MHLTTVRKVKCTGLKNSLLTVILLTVILLTVSCSLCYFILRSVVLSAATT